MLFYATHFVVAQLEAVHKPHKNTGFDLILKTSHLIFFSHHIYVHRLYFILIIFLVRYYLDCYFQHFTSKIKTLHILYTVYIFNAQHIHRIMISYNHLIFTRTNKKRGS